jgi:hypothetical protein
MSERMHFLCSGFRAMAIQAAMQRSPTYRERVTPAQTANFRFSLHCVLEKLANDSRYVDGSLEEEDHVENIVALSDLLTDLHEDILHGSKFRIGPAQKVLNVYLKYLWCAGEISTPPHCPLDAIVIRELGSSHRNCSWTQLDDIHKYCAMIEDAKRKADDGNVSLADWELSLWNKLQSAPSMNQIIARNGTARGA